MQTRRSRFHYVMANGRTLCGKWQYIGLGPVPEEGMDEHEQNCRACMKKKRALKG